MPDINDTIRRRHAEVEATENDARQLEARILKIPGTSRFIPLRAYGKPVDAAEIGRNLTLRSLIANHDPELASYLGIPTGQHRLDEEEREARQLQIEALQMQTDRLRQQNAANRHAREQAQLAGINPTVNRRYGI